MSEPLAKLVAHLKSLCDKDPSHGDKSKAFREVQLKVIKRRRTLIVSIKFKKKMEGLECGAIVAISNKNLELFEGVLQQLKQFYSSKKQSTKRQYLQGLMFLLVKNKQEAFHTEIELLEFEGLDVKDQIYYTKNKTKQHKTKYTYTTQHKKKKIH
ncbi:hypothetical protein RFI_10380 [Reticulomyxa filosa]|uniref:Uncharacterized protein n=1 Tax=Reticulomyxa filosa TaxID=46433 RepID=X6NLZ5_RETFI|nr:hypothetical protein RFI_10380 [Reticulomyxa filosa]|eukprot:ETO26754.1 hypothetical protein RFI_10380 [Reticulomyxa filosa]